MVRRGTKVKASNDRERKIQQPKAFIVFMCDGAGRIDHLEECPTGCDLVLVPAGMPRKPGMTRDDLFNVNADIAKGIVEAGAKYCPKAILALIVKPVNSMVLSVEWI